MIEVEHICLSFGKRKILEDVNLTVYDGETMVILGASGSGKSTLLKLIIGLLKPDSGSQSQWERDIVIDRTGNE